MLTNAHGLKMEFFPGRGVREVGIDEAGRGSLIGPVCVGAVVWDPTKIEEAAAIRDSKKISRKRREQLAEVIKQNALEWSVASADNVEIDEKNILGATLDTMHRAVRGLKTEPDFILVDGNHFKPLIKQKLEKGEEQLPDIFTEIDHACVPQGDNQYVSIAAASILAKVEHDRLIRELIDQHPELKAYGLETNMGYGTKKHFEAINANGITPWHRKSFNLIGGGGKYKA